MKHFYYCRSELTCYCVLPLHGGRSFMFSSGYQLRYEHYRFRTAEANTELSIKRCLTPSRPLQAKQIHWENTCYCLHVKLSRETSPLLWAQPKVTTAMLFCGTAVRKMWQIVRKLVKSSRFVQTHWWQETQAKMATQTQTLKKPVVNSERVHDYLYGE